MTTTAFRTTAAAVAPFALLAVAAAALAARGLTSEDLSVHVASAVSGWPEQLLVLTELVSEGGLLALAALLAIVAWRARTRGPRPVAVALLGGLGTVVALVVSEVTKVAVAQERPCRALPFDAAVTCPPTGDWSLPSNHATLAAALASAVVLVAPSWWRAVVPLALLVAASRVALGVHYPHDVVDGLLLGTVTVAAVVLALVVPAAALVQAAMQHHLLARWTRDGDRRPLGQRWHRRGVPARLPPVRGPPPLCTRRAGGLTCGPNGPLRPRGSPTTLRARQGFPALVPATG